MNAITTITFSTTQNSENRLATAISEANETLSTIQALLATQNETARSIAAKETLKHKYQIGRIYGTLKAYLDCMPDKIASNQKIDGIPLNFWIKMKVDEHVYEVTCRSSNWNSIEQDISKRYWNFARHICYFGTDDFEKRFKEFFPYNTHVFVLGFSESYSEAFHEIAKNEKIETDFTTPKLQDIWKNWDFFFKRDVYDYRLDGKFLFSFFQNCDPEYHFVNENVYASIRNHNNSAEFSEKSFDLNF